MGSIFSLLTSVTVVIGLWATLSSGCPAQPPQPAGSYTLSDSHPNYYLRPVCEYRPGVWVYVAMATPSCIWLINGSQPSAYQPYAHPTPLSILLQPFEQNLMNTIITCITPTRRYNFVIGDVCVCPNPLPSSTVGPAVSIAGHSSIPPYGPVISLSSATPQTTPPSDHTNAPSTTPNNTPAIIPLTVGVGVAVTCIIVLVSILCVCIRRRCGHNHGNHRGHGGADANGGAGPGRERVAGGHSNGMEVEAGEEQNEAMHNDHDETNNVDADVHISEDKRPISETAEEVDGSLLSAKSTSEISEKALQEHGYELTLPIKNYLKLTVTSQSSGSQEEDPPHSSTPSTQSSGYNQMYNDAGGANYSESKVTRSVNGKRGLPLSLPFHSLPSTPPSSVSFSPPSSPSCSTFSITSFNTGDSGVDVADMDTEDDGCTETEWEGKALVADGVEESTKEDMITGQEMNQDLHQVVDDAEIEGGYTTATKQTRLLIRTKGAHTKTKDRLVGVASVKYTPPSKWIPFTNE